MCAFRIKAYIGKLIRHRMWNGITKSQRIHFICINEACTLYTK